MKLQDRRYPVGKFESGKTWSLDDTRKHIKILARFPKDLKRALKKLKNTELDTPYRPGGWTARQVANHLADSHMNGYIRMKLAVTEPTPIIKPYEESAWAETQDGKNASVKLSLRLLGALHKRWVMFLESLSEEDLERGYFHPEQKRVISLNEGIALYAWHSRHHIAHIKLVSGDDTQEAENQETATPEAPKKRGPKPKAAGSTARAAKTEGPKLTRAEILAKARAARAANAAQKAPAAPAKSEEAPKRGRKSAAAKPAKTEGPKLTRGEILAKARAARAANAAQKAPKAAENSNGEPKRSGRKGASAEKKAAKPASDNNGTPKKRGLSAERMAEIRAMRKKK